MRQAETILAFGDSIAKGYGAPFKEGWMQRLLRHFAAAHNFVDSKAVYYDQTTAGENAAKFAGRAAFVASEDNLYNWPQRRTLSIVSLGLNEPSANVRAGRGPNDLDTFAGSFAVGVRALLNIGDVMYVGSCPPDVLHITDGDESDAARRRDSFIRFENAACEIVASQAARAGRRYGIVPLYELLESDQLYGWADHVHPDDDSHEVVYGIVKPVFDDLSGLNQSL